MNRLEKVLYTANAHTTGGRAGMSRSSDGRLEVSLSRPGSPGTGTNPDHQIRPFLRDDKDCRTHCPMKKCAGKSRFSFRTAGVLITRCRSGTTAAYGGAEPNSCRLVVSDLGRVLINRDCPEIAADVRVFSECVAKLFSRPERAMLIQGRASATSIQKHRSFGFDNCAFAAQQGVLQNYLG